MKERCDKAAQELDQLYTEKKKMEDMELLNAIHKSTRSKAEILAFLESRA